jgi:Tol biopolymer transport system component
MIGVGGGRNCHVRPSPNGHQIAYDSDRYGGRAVYVAESDGTIVRRVSGAGYAELPSWSPDGRFLAFVRGEPLRTKVWNLWVRDMRTSGFRRLTSFRSGQTWTASWFPDSRRVAFTHDNQLIVLDITNGRTRTFRSPVRGSAVRTPAVSPDGRRVIFQVTDDGPWLLDMRTGAMQPLLDDPTAEEFAWTPLGNRVAYHSHRDGAWRIWIASVPS